MLVTCALIVAENKVLVCRRPRNKSRGGLWEFPGGKVQSGERPADCIKRELLEELGITVGIIKTLDAVHHYYPDLEIKLLPFVCEIAGGKITLHEHSEVKWLNEAQLRNMQLCDADKLILRQPGIFQPDV